MKQVRNEALQSKNQLQVSMDAKAVVKVGQFSRGGMSYVPVRALDHDYQPDAKVTPVGLLVPEYDELYITMVTSKVTADCLVDQVEGVWRQNRARWRAVDTLVLLLDNGPENHSHRSRFVERMVHWADRNKITVRLAYYPPYHSKYNPVERCWGVLENHWNGTLLDSIEKVVGYAKTMRWRGKNPVVRRVDQVYVTGLKLSKTEMAAVERRLLRKPGLEKWFVDIRPLGRCPQ